LTQRQLSHKNIVSFIDSAIISAHSKQAFQSAADEVYILMENCSGSIIAPLVHVVAASCLGRALVSSTPLTLFAHHLVGEDLVKTLNRHSEQRKSMAQAQILKIFAEVCEAVAHMHNQNPPIAHRDLKVLPASIGDLLVQTTSSCNTATGERRPRTFW
jgi:serine/threonine protein kinase